MRVIPTYTYDLRRIEELFTKAYVPYLLFNKMLYALINNDLTTLNDNVLIGKIYATKKDIDTYIKDMVYAHIYKCKDYDNLIALIANLFTLLNVLIDLRKNITNMSDQPFVVVQDYLKSFGFNIYNVFNEATTRRIAKQIYYYLRKKGTPHLMSILLNLLGFNYFVIAEYWLHKYPQNYNWYLVPEIVYKSRAVENVNFSLSNINANSRNDALWWLTDEDCNKIFFGD